MNKKFTTFLASAILVSAFSVGTVAAYVGTAAPAGEAASQLRAAVTPKKDQTVLFKISDGEYLAAGNEKSEFGKFVSVEPENSEFKLTELNQAMWTVSAVKNTLGETLYSFVNKATGLAFAVDPALAVTADKKDEAKEVTLGGSATEWVVKGGTLVSYVDGKKFVYLATEAGKTILVKAETVGDDKVAIGFNVDDIPASMSLGADDLNKLLQSVSTAGYFGLNMDPNVSTGNVNHMTATALKASISSTSGYVTLAVKDKKIDDKQAYVVVDTAYYAATEDAKMLKFTYDKVSDKREAGSYDFKFTYNAQKNELYAQVREVAYKLAATEGKATEYAKNIKEDNNNSWWTVKDGFTSTNGAAELSTAKDKYIYMANLAGNRVLTVNTDVTDAKCYENRTESSDGTLKTGVDITNALQRTKITLGTNFTGLTPTTLADGVYMIQFKSGGSDRNELKGAYALANLAGNFGWAKQAERQDFNHMPAAQWVVTKNGVSSTSSISIQNREFNDKADEGAYPTVNIPENVQLYAVKDSKDVFFYTTVNNQTFVDTVSFIAINDAKNLKLGYRYVSEDSAMVQTYVFNYLHGLALDKYLYTPNGKDSIVRVDENGDKTNFRLVVVAKDDHYGVGDSLVRNVYQIKNGNSYLSYDSKVKKYVMTSTPTNFFLKENNCIDGKHYYALVEAAIREYTVAASDAGKIYAPKYNGLKSTDKVIIEGESVDVPTLQANDKTPLFDADGNYLVKDNSVIKKAYVYKANEDSKIVLTEITIADDDQKYSSSVAQNGLKVSVDDNTLDLTQGSTDDKFDTGSNREIRTSAFAVQIDDSPLYRRFNNAALGESETADSLYFVEKIREEYLMDEWNPNLTDKIVDYAGIWNKEQANGKLAFIADTVWVNRGAGMIKPQYLISVAREDQAGTPGIPCTYEHNHYDNAGNKVNAAECSHATKAHPGFDYGKYLVSFGDSVLVKGKEFKTPYMDIDGGYTRVGFVKAIHYGDSLYVLTNGFEKMAPAELDVETIIANYKKAGLEKFIVNLQGDNHKNVTWSFRYVNPSNEAAVATEEGEANEFLFESNIYSETAAVAVTGDAGKATKGFDKAVAGSIAPQYAAWLKMQNGCLVLTRGDSEFGSAKTGSDGALIFNAYQKTDAEDMVTSNDEVAVEGVSIVTGNGVVTIQGAAGKSVVITNILGKVIAETVLTSDNATISVPAGIVAVAVEGEEAVKAIVK